ncbi:MAG TPA: radical SAM protein [Sedimenticola sp.]|nr:radical SAM protein [Sedimenticola sp.]
MHDLYLIAINLTRRCNLACAHCYMDAETRETGGAEELTSDEVEGLLDQIAARGNETMVVLTGGEPLLRRDLERLVRHGSGLGLAMVVGSNGVLLDERRARSLQAAGTLGVGISLDSLDPAAHDAFRGCPGSWERTLAGMEHCRRLGLPFQVHFSVTEHNAHEVPAMIAFARAAGAHVLNIFFLVCTGRGESMSDISPARYEEVLKQLVEAQGENDDLVIRARCAPHYKRIAYQLDPASPLTRAQGYEGGGCLAGTHYCRITPEGAVTACPYIPNPEGSIRERPFWEIWDHAPTFERLRHPDLGGQCGQCEYRRLCGGCRARPLAMGGDLMDTDPWCSHHPTGRPLIEPLTEAGRDEIGWTPEAEQRLARVPGFLRRMVRKRAEDHVRERGERQVTPAHLSTLAARRFGDRFPGVRPGTATEPSPPVDLPATGLAWTREATLWLEELPAFLHRGIRQVAEEVAREEGRLEVNLKLVRRLETDAAPGPRMDWTPGAGGRLEALLAERPPPVAQFIRPALEEAAEREARRRGAERVATRDVEQAVVTRTAGVTWEPEALARVEAAPEFIRGGIKKAAEAAARREDLRVIRSDDLTRFRNRAMLRAVRRMKGFGMRELAFDAWGIARERVPRLRDNPQAERRFAEIRGYVEARRAADGSGLGVLDQALLAQMKTALKDHD